jgi:3-methyladenine DNA glycosylase/8-oxoguanine DNA glycosylase
MPTPAELLATDAETLRGVGMSRAKAAYLHDLAARLGDGRLDLDRVRTLDDDAARTALTEVKGVGRFTADGVLILALRRADVWPPADLALRRAGRADLEARFFRVGRAGRRARGALPAVAHARHRVPLFQDRAMSRCSHTRR